MKKSNSYLGNVKVEKSTSQVTIINYFKWLSISLEVWQKLAINKKVFSIVRKHFKLSQNHSLIDF